MRLERAWKVEPDGASGVSRSRGGSELEARGEVVRRGDSLRAGLNAAVLNDVMRRGDSLCAGSNAAVLSAVVAQVFWAWLSTLAPPFELASAAPFGE